MLPLDLLIWPGTQDIFAGMDFTLRQGMTGEPGELMIHDPWNQNNVPNTKVIWPFQKLFRKRFRSFWPHFCGSHLKGAPSVHRASRISPCWQGTRFGLQFGAQGDGWDGWITWIYITNDYNDWIVSLCALHIKYLGDFQRCIANDGNLQVLFFFAKLSQGTGEQLLTRQMFRLGHEMATCNVGIWDVEANRSLVWESRSVYCVYVWTNWLRLIDIGFGPWMKSGISCAQQQLLGPARVSHVLGLQDVRHIGLGQSPRGFAVEWGVKFEWSDEITARDSFRWSNPKTNGISLLQQKNSFRFYYAHAGYYLTQFLLSKWNLD